MVFYTSAILKDAVRESHAHYEQGNAFLVTAMGQFALNPQWALQLSRDSLDSRHKSVDRHEEDPATRLSLAYDF